MDPNPNLAPQVTHQPTLLGGAENMKLLFDEELDSRREVQARARAWQAVSLDMAQTASRRAQNAATFDHFVNMTSAAATATAQQTGQTENEQTVSPAGTAASETAKGAVADAGAGVAVAAEGVATANQSIADAVANLMNALTAVIVTASGGASTPSQTQAKPTS